LSFELFVSILHDKCTAGFYIIFVFSFTRMYQYVYGLVKKHMF